jgi:hypothetical protein
LAHDALFLPWGLSDAELTFPLPVRTTRKPYYNTNWLTTANYSAAFVQILARGLPD